MQIDHKPLQRTLKPSTRVENEGFLKIEICILGFEDNPVYMVPAKLMASFSIVDFEEANDNTFEAH
jgi:hypothetical protein